MFSWLRVKSGRRYYTRDGDTLRGIATTYYKLSTAAPENVEEPVQQVVALLRTRNGLEIDADAPLPAPSKLELPPTKWDSVPAHGGRTWSLRAVTIGYVFAWLLPMLVVFGLNYTQPLWALALGQPHIDTGVVAQSPTSQVAATSGTSRLAAPDDTRPAWLQVIGPHLAAELTQAVGWLSSQLLPWTAAVWLLWLYRRRTPDPQLWKLVQYGILWVVGTTILVSWENRWLADSLKEIEPTLVLATRPLPIVTLWSAAILLLYVVRGDGSLAWKHYVRQYRDVWTSLILTFTVAIVGGIFVYDSVDHRVQGLLVSRELASASLNDTGSAATSIADHVTALRSDIQAYANITSKSPPTPATDALGATQTAQGTVLRSNLLDLIRIELAQIDGDLTRVESSQATASAQLDVAADTEAPGPDKTMSLTPIRSALARIQLPTAQLRKATAGLESDVQALGADPNQAIPVVGLLATIERDVIPNVQAMVSTSRVTGSASSAVGAAALALYIWAGAFFGVLVLLPWGLVLLFLFRKRLARAAQIRDDLTRLDPAGRLLHRVLDSTRGRRPDASAATTTDDPERVDPQIKEVANGAFSNFEFLVNLAGLTVLLAVGWYYVFYPNTFTGLAVLIEQGGGLGAVNDYFVKNLSPITLGFAGAYFWILATLLRRYFAGDLYPSVLLQGSVRLLTVFILTLLLGNVAQLAQWDAHAVAALAFFGGITPNTIIQGIAKIVTKATSIPLSTKEDSPLTQLEGLNGGDESRLLEENIESVLAMATAQIEQLVLRTHFSTGQIVDWVDQAILYTHCGVRGRWFEPLHSVGIRSASQLLGVAGWPVYELPRTYISTPKPDWSALGRISASLASVQEAANVTEPEGFGQARQSVRGLRDQANELIDPSTTCRDLLQSIRLDCVETLDYIAALWSTAEKARTATLAADAPIGALVAAVQPITTQPDATILATQSAELSRRMARAHDLANGLEGWMPARPPQAADPERVAQTQSAITGWVSALRDVRVGLDAVQDTLETDRQFDTATAQLVDAAKVALDCAVMEAEAAHVAAQRLNPADPTSFNALHTASRRIETLRGYRDAVVKAQMDAGTRVNAVKSGRDTWAEVKEIIERATEQVQKLTSSVDALTDSVGAVGTNMGANPPDLHAAAAALSTANSAATTTVQFSRAALELSEEALSKLESAIAEPVLTADILYIMCQAIWPNPNLEFVLNFKNPPSRGSLRPVPEPTASREVNGNVPIPVHTNGKVPHAQGLANGHAASTLVPPPHPSPRTSSSTAVRSLIYKVLWAVGLRTNSTPPTDWRQRTTTQPLLD